jgi:glycosyltransferase involved in cell wall biosynthesis
MVNDGVSVVTTTWNEWNNVEKLVVEIRKALRGHPHEIIVVDDSSTDGTMEEEVAKRFEDVAVTKPREGQSKGLLYECIWQNTP